MSGGRGATGREWRNWAGDQVCTPAAVERPGRERSLGASAELMSGRSWFMLELVDYRVKECRRLLR